MVVITMIIKMNIKVIVCTLSIKVLDVLDGTMDSTMYLLPIAANIPPTQRPNRESWFSDDIKNTMREIRKATYTPVSIFTSFTQELFLLMVTLATTAG